MEHSAALQCAQQQAQEALQQEIDAMQADHAQALRAADTEREALAKVTCQAYRALKIAGVPCLTDCTHPLDVSTDLGNISVKGRLEALLRPFYLQMWHHLWTLGHMQL